MYPASRLRQSDMFLYCDMYPASRLRQSDMLVRYM